MTELVPAPDPVAPPAAVLDAFGATGPPRRLPGGKGGTWQSGDIVLKPAEGDDETRWRSDVLAALPDDPRFRVARPVRARDGDWLADGWTAAEAVAGQPAPRRVDDVIRAGEAFHQAIAALPRPSFLDHRDDPWTYGDRLAWNEPVPPGATAPSVHLSPLIAARRPVTLPAQVVHGDLSGNVLFADGLPPAIIDWPAYWRPPAWAAAVVVVDALCWHGADPQVIDRWANLPAWDQMLIRALIYRIATWPAARWATPPDDEYRPVAKIVLAYADTRR
ncbi:MAG TPA: TIGR02569 family protein [Actinoplanes sp.]|nr:TIGR02569 family protein [Actinoplanes sp.]